MVTKVPVFNMFNVLNEIDDENIDLKKQKQKKKANSDTSKKIETKEEIVSEKQESSQIISSTKKNFNDNNPKNKITCAYCRNIFSNNFELFVEIDSKVYQPLCGNCWNMKKIFKTNPIDNDDLLDKNIVKSIIFYKLNCIFSQPECKLSITKFFDFSSSEKEEMVLMRIVCKSHYKQLIDPSVLHFTSRCLNPKCMNRNDNTTNLKMVSYLISDKSMSRNYFNIIQIVCNRCFKKLKIEELQNSLN